MNKSSLNFGRKMNNVSFDGRGSSDYDKDGVQFEFDRILKDQKEKNMVSKMLMKKGLNQL